MTTWLITGGAGFIGSAFVRLLLTAGDDHIVNVDKLTYAGNLESLPSADDNRRYTFERIDICDSAAVRKCIHKHAPDYVVHLAAESHVDRSIDGPGLFIQTNVVGTFVLLQECQRYYQSMDASGRTAFRFVHVSTDEVFGSLGPAGRFTEETPYDPRSPYSASKAASDHLARAWYHTYGLPTIVTNCSNNYGPYQFPEKLIPLTIQNALKGNPIGVYGKGENVRDWLYVDDHARALMLAAKQGVPGDTYNIGGDNERRNIDVVREICRLVDEWRPQSAPHSRLIEFVADRPGHDARYSIDPAKARRELQWTPRETFATGLKKTVDWYVHNVEWTNRVQSGAYQGERLGLGGSTKSQRR